MSRCASRAWPLRLLGLSSGCCVTLDCRRAAVLGAGSVSAGSLSTWVASQPGRGQQLQLVGGARTKVATGALDSQPARALIACLMHRRP